MVDQILGRGQRFEVPWGSGLVIVLLSRAGEAAAERLKFLKTMDGPILVVDSLSTSPKRGGWYVTFPEGRTVVTDDILKLLFDNNPIVNGHELTVIRDERRLSEIKNSGSQQVGLIQSDKMPMKQDSDTRGLNSIQASWVY